MQFTTFGRTGLQASVAGLGCGGFSRLGLGTGGSADNAVAIVRAAIELGVNFIDTAAAYGTEAVVGRAIAGFDRSTLIIATKSGIGPGAGFSRGPDIATATDVVASLDNSLRTLGTDYVDVFQLHAVTPDNYARVREELVPALLAERAKGKFRHLGITETPPYDLQHQMLQRAVPDGPWESVMVAYHMLHQNARAFRPRNGTITHAVTRLMRLLSRPACHASWGIAQRSRYTAEPARCLRSHGRAALPAASP